MTILEFGEYLPDLGEFNNPGITTARNVLPFGESYKSLQSAVIFSDPLDARAQGLAPGRDNDGNTFTFAGDKTKLYESSDTAWTDVSKTATTYSTPADGQWEFAQFSNKILASNFSNNIQSFTMGTSTNFDDLAGSPPRARHIATVRDFVVTANTFDSVDGNKPERVRWSAIGDETNWTVDIETQSDFQDLVGDGGWCQKVVGGEFGTIFQERKIYVMTYLGVPAVFQFDEVEKDRGTIATNSVIKISSNIFYLGQDGFYVFDGRNSTSIGANKIDKTFFTDLDNNHLDRVYAASDPINKIVFWCYPGVGSSDGICNRLLAFNYSSNALKRWTLSDANLQLLGNSLSEGKTLDQLDSISPTLDGLPFSLDSRAWTGNETILSGFNPDNKLVTFSGDAVDAQITTTQAQLNENGTSEVTLVRPIVEGNSNTTVTVEMGSRNDLTNTVSFAAAATEVSNGDIPTRSNARFHSARVNISGGFDHAKGIDVIKVNNTGDR